MTDSGGFAERLTKHWERQGLIIEVEPGVWESLPLTPDEMRARREWLRKHKFRQVAPGVRMPISPEFFLIWAILAWDRFSGRLLSGRRGQR